MHQLLSSTSVPMPSLASWREAASTCGFALEPVLREAGISQVDGHAPVRVSPVNLFKAFSLCVDRAKGHHFPFALGERFVFEHFAEFDAFMGACSTIRDGLELAGWARDLLAPWLTVRLDEFGSEAHLRIVIDAPGVSVEELRPVREVALSVVNQVIRRATREPNWLLSVRLAGPPPQGHDRYAGHFGVPVLFNEEIDALVMDRRWLDLPLTPAYPQAQGEARQRIERRLNQELGERRRLVDEVRWALERRPELLREGLEATAVALGLHPRTLQRRLQAEGVKFVDIQSEAKQHRAQIMLRRRAISMESISTELGFSDRRAFTFAFKRWTGMSPSAYRSQLGVSGR